MNSILQNKTRAFIVAVSAIILGIFIGFLTATTSAIPYNGPDTEPSPVPVFNIYTGVPDVGDESEFFYGKVDGSTSDSVKNVVASCETGTRFALRAYVHNGASQYKNGTGDGPSVAHDTKIKVAVPGTEASKFVPEATISSSNAASISDTMTITCSDGRTVTMSYVAGSAQQYNTTSGVQPVSDSIVTTGAPIGTNAPDGDLWGSWDQRVWVRLIVEVTEVKPEPLPAVCIEIFATLRSGNQVRVDDVEYKLNDATLNYITLDYGDGNSENVQPSELPKTHTYSDAGEYTVRATLNTTFEGKTEDVTSDACAVDVEIKENPDPAYACEMYSLKINDRKATVSFLPTSSNGATFKNATIRYIADGKLVNEVTTDKLNSEGKVMDMYTFSSTAVNIAANAQVRFDLPNGEVVVEDCAGEAVLGSTTPVTPTVIPDTGAGSAIGILAAISAVGAYAHRAFTLKRQ